ncbi:hypothetical protein BH09MYX1_BH09MYX1_19410 [soil metagenome]
MDSTNLLGRFARMMGETMLKVGDSAPDIDAVATTGERFVLSQSSHRCTVVYFFPKAFTPGCTAEAKLFGKDHVELALAGARVVGISTDDHKTQCNFASSVSAPFPMIADEGGRISRSFGVLWPLIAIPHRATFVIDEDMKIVAALRDDLSVVKHRDEALRAVDALSRARATMAAAVAPDVDVVPPAAPIQVGRYALFDRIAAGGMASVHLARLVGEAGFSRTVAIKRLHRRLLDAPEFAHMMVDEARMAARIHHPNVASTLDVVAVDRELLVVLEYVHGLSLAYLIKQAKGPVPHEIVASVAAGMLHGLHAAHEARAEGGSPMNLVHRDVSPSNVLVGRDGVARLIDFGVAKAIGKLHATQQGVLKGKFGYMAPEQIAGGEVDRRTDVFAAGVVVWEMLTGVRFRGSNTGIAEAARGGGPPPSSRVANLDPRWDSITTRAFAPKARDRYPTARDMAVAVETMRIATTSEVAAWVHALGRDELARMAQRVSAIERVTLG